MFPSSYRLWARPCAGADRPAHDSLQRTGLLQRRSLSYGGVGRSARHIPNGRGLFRFPWNLQINDSLPNSEGGHSDDHGSDIG